MFRKGVLCCSRAGEHREGMHHARDILSGKCNEAAVPGDHDDENDIFYRATSSGRRRRRRASTKRHGVVPTAAVSVALLVRRHATTTTTTTFVGVRGWKTSRRNIVITTGRRGERPSELTEHGVTVAGDHPCLRCATCTRCAREPDVSPNRVWCTPASAGRKRVFVRYKNTAPRC